MATRSLCRARSGTRSSIPKATFSCTISAPATAFPILPQPEYAATASQIRIAPLWGLRTRNRLIHDGLSFTRQEAIQKHGGQAASVTNAYNALTSAEQNQLMAFLDSL